MVGISNIFSSHAIMKLLFYIYTYYIWLLYILECESFCIDSVIENYSQPSTRCSLFKDTTNTMIDGAENLGNRPPSRRGRYARMSNEEKIVKKCCTC
jgi:hypothetical protein